VFFLQVQQPVQLQLQLQVFLFTTTANTTTSTTATTTTTATATATATTAIATSTNNSDIFKCHLRNMDGWMDGWTCKCKYWTLIQSGGFLVGEKKCHNQEKAATAHEAFTIVISYKLYIAAAGYL